jgi:hypothetical protein
MAFNPTDEQRAVLAHDLRRHCRILAGPGTGKSATLITLLNGLPRFPDSGQAAYLYSCRDRRTRAQTIRGRKRSVRAAQYRSFILHFRLVE